MSCDFFKININRLCRKSPMINAEMFCRLIAYNIGAYIIGLFLQSHINKKTYKNSLHNSS